MIENIIKWFSKSAVESNKKIYPETPQEPTYEVGDKSIRYGSEWVWDGKQQVIEPLYSFVQLVKSDRKRFKVWTNPYIYSTTYCIKDLKTEEEFSVTFYRGDRRLSGKSNNLNWATEAQLCWVYEQLYMFYQGLGYKKARRAYQLKQRAQKKDHERLLNTYCKEDSQ